MRRALRPSSLFRRLMLGFSSVVVIVFVLGLWYVIKDAQITQRARTAAENRAHTREALLHLSLLAAQPERMVAAAQELERVRKHMFQVLDYHSMVRLKVWKDGRLVYNSLPALPEALPMPTDPRPSNVNGWVRAVERDDAAGLVVERSHEVDDLWMLSMSGISFLASSTVFSLPLLLLPAWLIVKIGLRPVGSIADQIEQRSVSDLTALPESKYRELSPLVDAINRLMKRLSERIEREHEFLTDAAHELKTPLAAIQVNAHLLVSRVGPEAAARCAEAVDGLRDGVSRATHMVHQLLALERAHTEPSAEPMPLSDLGTLVRDRLAAAAPLALQRNVEIEFQADAECPLPLHIESMAALVDNLISNAIKYSPEGGRVTVQLAPTDGGCALTISDQGPGIDSSLHRKVFERFYRIPGQEQSGSGLGLAIAERAAERNAGSITLSAADDDKGLRVQVHFTPA
ncbi:two-component sensor histidine kinase [Massilia arenosa]|uniref:histidine kinase n=1 Tax=Zemynaea arenosa TaxID=2561931 RepID=A0A4Y9SER0_9BURK|nr:ATP-binding protein [Massilia arenosa]TFW19345.1 two-component sensor histidine kinase [Massilia arenosa]